MASRKNAGLKQPARILIVDDHPLIREGVTARVARQPDLEVCGEAEDVQDALERIEQMTPDLVIIDISLKVGHGLDLIKQIKALHPNLKMLVLSAHDESLYAERALRAGAMGYLNKQETRANIIDAIRQVLAGGRYLSAHLRERLLAQAIDGNSGSTSPIDQLSDRELEVFTLIGRGISSRAIAEQLGLSIHTIDSYREKLKSKLKSRDSVELTHDATQWVLENL